MAGVNVQYLAASKRQSCFSPNKYLIYVFLFDILKSGQSAIHLVQFGTSELKARIIWFSSGPQSSIA